MVASLTGFGHPVSLAVDWVSTQPTKLLLFR